MSATTGEPLIVYTYQISQWRKLQQRGIALVDTTVKTGHVQLAPTWDMVWNHKKGLLSDDAYSVAYRGRLEYAWFQDPLFFEQLFALREFAVGCYCTPGKFCHRHLLVSFIQQAAPTDYRGELS